MSATPEQIAERLDGATVRADELPDTRPVYTTETVTLYVVPLGLTLADLRAAAALIRAQAERVRVLEGALEAIKSDAAHVIDFYNRNGPTWTGKDGHEYDDMSSVLGRAETVIQQIDAALRGEA